jgi:hypothetical protein
LRFSGQILEKICMVFLSSSCRETAKNAIKNRLKIRSFYGVFALPLPLVGKRTKNAIKNNQHQILKKRKAPTYRI